MGIIQTALPHHQILRRKQVEARIGLKKSTLYQRVADGTFPKPVSLGLRAVGWVEAEVNSWLANQIAQSRKGGAQ